ncbi:MAG TPA: transmembrane 220 family protein [Eudoraea sp.]|nr:transmembrane 220 family protein [Eudoraea sp.]
MKTLFKILALVFALLFLLAALVQYNDPDAFLWYVIYGIAALVSLFFFFGRMYYVIPAILCILYLIGTFWAWPETFEGVEIGGGDIDNIERGREALGLLITSVVMLMFALRIRFAGRS